MDSSVHGEPKVKGARSLIVGSTGQVARALLEELRSQGESPLHTSSSGAASLALDLSEPSSVSALFKHLDRAFPGELFQVYLCGAMTHVDRCEEERDRCRQMNALSPGLIAEECYRRGHSLVFFSTEYVFGQEEYEGGAVGPFSEEDRPAPTSWYGQCKLEGEFLVQEAMHGNALILRTTMVFSWDPGGNNVLMQYLNRLRDLRDGKSPPVFRIPEDQVSTPTYAPYLASATLQLAAQGARGIYNLVGSTLLSRKQLVETVIDHFGFDPEKSLAGFCFLKTAELGQKAKRPLSAGLTMHKAQAVGIEPWSLEQSLRKVPGCIY